MGEKVKRNIRWSNKAFTDFIYILNYIKEDSPANAVKVKSRVLKIIASIPQNPEMFREDELKTDNNGTFRAFSKDNIRVSYKIEPKAIFIARIRHSSQEPLQY